jgi:hypothetical protein
MVEAAAPAADEGTGMDTTWYVEHRGVGTRRHPCDDPARFAERVGRLAALGERGEVVLVEAASGLVVARRHLPGSPRDGVAGTGNGDGR